MLQVSEMIALMLNFALTLQCPGSRPLPPDTRIPPGDRTSGQRSRSKRRWGWQSWPMSMWMHRRTWLTDEELAEKTMWVSQGISRGKRKNFAILEQINTGVWYQEQKEFALTRVSGIELLSQNSGQSFMGQESFCYFCCPGREKDTLKTWRAELRYKNRARLIGAAKQTEMKQR